LYGTHQGQTTGEGSLPFIKKKSAKPALFLDEGISEICSLKLNSSLFNGFCWLSPEPGEVPHGERGNDQFLFHISLLLWRRSARPSIPRKCLPGYDLPAAGWLFRLFHTNQLHGADHQGLKGTGGLCRLCPKHPAGAAGKNTPFYFASACFR
jgi:hypothetical protein